jgi:hypothetical protein
MRIRSVTERIPNLPERQLVAIGRFFSSAVMRELGRLGRSPLFTRLLRESCLDDLLTSDQPVSRIFDRGLEILSATGCRPEYVYKNAITRRILLGRHSLRSAVMLTEFRVGKCKADVAILNGTSTVYEIKSERDRLDRLAEQLAAYLQVFAQVNVIAGKNHVSQILKNVPEQVGVLVLSGRSSVSTIRAATEDVGRIVPATVFDSLQLHESTKILKRLGIHFPIVPNTQQHRVVRERFVTLAPHDLHTAMIEVLRSTRSLAHLESLINALPSSLRTVALSTPLRNMDRQRLVSAMSTSIEDAHGWAV